MGKQRLEAADMPVLIFGSRSGSLLCTGMKENSSAEVSSSPFSSVVLPLTQTK